MKCFRVSVGGVFVGLVAAADRHFMSGLLQQYGDELFVQAVIAA